VLPSHSPSGTFTPAVVIPSATTLVGPVRVDPVDHQHHQANVIEPPRHQRVEMLARTRDERSGHRRLRHRPLRRGDLLTDRLAGADQPPSVTSPDS